MALGTVCVFSAGANVGMDYDLQHFYDFTTLKQIIFFPLAVAIMYLTSRTNYERFSFRGIVPVKSFTPYLLILAIALLILVLVPGIGVERHGVRRWLDLAPGSVYVSFQPSELAKWALVFFLAAFIDKFAETTKLYWRRFVPVCLVAGVVVGLIVTQDFGTAAFITLLTFLMLVIGRACWWHFLTGLPVILPAFYFAIVVSPTRINRIKTFIDPDVISYQARQSLIAISSGGIWGKGLGKGVCKYGHLPEDTTDFIFAIIAEELGFVGAAFVIALFVAFVVLGITIVIRCDDRFGRLLAGGIVLTIAIQAAINIGVATVVLPTKGISLPFISAGGTGMLLSAAAVGVLLNIAKQTDGAAQISAQDTGAAERTGGI
jgi:cell division protein FtsW